MPAERGNDGGAPNGGLGWLAEGVFLSALIAGWSYLLSPGGEGAFSGLAERVLPKRIVADGQPAAEAGRELGTDAAPTAKEKAGVDESKRVAGGTERRSVGDVLGGPAFSGGGAFQVSLKGASNSGAPAAPVMADLALAGERQKRDLAPTPPAARALEPDVAPAAIAKAATAGTPNEGAARAQKAQPEKRRTPSDPPPAARAGPPATLLLSKVSGRLADRADLNVSMSIELLFNEDSALRRELEFKRDVLTAAAGATLRKHEYGNVNAAILKADLLDAFNKQLQAGKLSGIGIKDFLIGTAGGGS